MLGVGCRISGSCSALQGARIKAAVAAWRDAVFADARSDGRRDPIDAYNVDALDRALAASLAQDGPTAEPTPATPPAGETTSPTPTPDEPAGDPPARPFVGRPSRSPRHKVIVHVSHTALLRGHPVPGELCEIDGAGPVPVSAVQDLLDSGDAFLAAVVTDGVDIHAVTHVGRAIPAVVRTALEVRDRACVVPGCGNSGYFELDHITSATGWADTGRTRLDELARLCTFHHEQKTHHHWRLTGGPGRWQWHPPPTRRDGRDPPDQHAA